MVSSQIMVITVTLMTTETLARLDTLSPSDYLTLAIDCKDSRIQVGVIKFYGTELRLIVELDPKANTFGF